MPLNMHNMPANMLLSLAEQAANAVDKHRLVTLCQELIQIRSVYEVANDGTVTSSEKDCADFIFNYFKALGLNPTMEYPEKERPNVIVDWAGTEFDSKKHKTLMFEGHTDVVTEGNADDWDHPPFSATIIGDSLYGRGSADMKAGIAAAIIALEAVMQVAPELTGRIRFGIVSDEEGLMLGIKEFINQGWADEVSAAIICEPEENELCLFQKGAMRVACTVTGKMSHGAMPYAGKNPIPALARFITAIEHYQEKEQNRLGEHEFLGYPWFTPTILQAPPSGKGEAQLNVMPAEAYMTLDIRTVPGQNHDDILKHLEHLAIEACQNDEVLEISLDCFESRPWTQTADDDPIVQSIEAVYPSIMKKAPKYGGVPGATDGTFLRAWKDIPIVTIGPGDRLIPHQKNEFVRIEEMYQSAKLYAATAIYYLTEPED